jgi:hypothetical protein
MRKKKTTIDKNFDLLVKFNTYLTKNPDVAKDMPRNTCIFFEVESDKDLTRVNKKLAIEAKKEGENCTKAIKSRRGWKIEPIFA